MSRAGRCLVVVLLGLGLLSTSCGLPTDDTVRRSGTVQPDVAESRGSVRELPPAPQPDATPRDILDGFVQAQISGEDQHAVSRDYLLPGTEWADDAGVTVFRPGLTLTPVDGDASGDGPLTYQVRFEQVGAIGPDGAATVAPPVERAETFRLVRDEAGEWRIDALPDGLLLSTETRDAAFSAATIYFLPATPGGATPHLVADRQLLPVGSGPDLLVRRVLAPPSSGLADSGQTAAPPGTDLLRPVEVDASGADAVVDLTAQAATLVPSAREALAAQLVWTLRQVPGLLRLQLLVEGEPLLSGRRDKPLVLRDAYDSADPQGDQRASTALVDGQVRAVQGPVPASVRSAKSVMDLAVDPRSGEVALLSGTAEAATLRVGSPDGPLRTVADQAGLRSPTWGDGSYGVWMLRTGQAPAVLVARGGTLRRVTFPGLPTLDASSTLRVSRDGTRVLLVSDGELLLARVVPPAEGATGSARQVPLLKDVRQLRSVGTVAADWLDPTTLAVLVSETRPLLLVSIDNLNQDAVNQPLQEVRARSVAALGELPLLVGAVADDSSPAPSGVQPGTEPPGATEEPAPGPDAAPEARLYAGRPEESFEIELRDAVRPRYPG